MGFRSGQGDRTACIYAQYFFDVVRNLFQTKLQELTL